MNIFRCTIIAVIIAMAAGFGSYKNVGSCKMVNVIPTTEQVMKYNGQVLGTIPTAAIDAVIEMLPKIIRFCNGIGDKDKKKK